MLQRIIATIDALGERLSPYYVLQRRRVFRATHAWITTPFLYSMIAAIGVVGFIFSDTVERLGRELISVTDWRLLLPFASMQLLFFAAMTQSGTWINYWAVKKADPLMFLTPIPKRELYFGYRQMELFDSLCLLLVFLPFLAIAYCSRVISLEWATLYPWGLWAGTMTLGNVFFSVSLASNKTRQAIVLGILWATTLVGFAFLAFTLVLLSLVHRHGHFSPVFMAVFSFVAASAPRWPVFLLGVLFFNATAWKLCNYNLVEDRPFVQKLGVSLAAFFGITLLLLAVWTLIWAFVKT